MEGRALPAAAQTNRPAEETIHPLQPASDGFKGAQNPPSCAESCAASPNPPAAAWQPRGPAVPGDRSSGPPGQGKALRERSERGGDLESLKKRLRHLLLRLLRFPAGDREPGDSAGGGRRGRALQPKPSSPSQRRHLSCIPTPSAARAVSHLCKCRAEPLLAPGRAL